ncbi:helix-turn-helix domain-containing protein [Clostridium scatologenes]|uniref:Transcriptional regulator, XRE family n=1 Tax=Clostridium scatologenes TaxID=1548 RepID=A0A0E3K1P8_CLOSL|nr:helix-turn-helix transcriptional regulator [Clostridium scatologenes]AKA70170.1 transcriptional regulator, XRE family [Clostridium scatologenes]
MIGLSYIRELYNLSMQDLADKLSISRQVVHQWESKKVRVADKRIKQISQMFNMSEKYIGNDVTEIDKLEMQRIKLQNEIKDYEFKYEDTVTDPDTGEEITIMQTGVDEGAMFDLYLNTYQINEKKLLTNIKNSLDQCFIRGEEYEDCMDHGLGEAGELLELYERLFQLVNNPKVYKNTLKEIIMAFNVAYGKTITSDKFIRKIAKAIKDHDEENRREWGEFDDEYKNSKD